MLLPAADLRIDHVTAAGRDLKSMQAALAKLGISSEYGGPHSNHATEMALTSFPDGSYLELIAIQASADPAAVAAHYWSKPMQN
ncbi:MAG TPA: VOC family protein, partial [Bryobacteraceae bacterium]